MNTVATSLITLQPSHSSALQTPLSAEVLRERVPAAFAPTAHERTSGSYTFISSANVLTALASAGFLPVDARQAARARSPLHARHLIRLRRRFETIALRDPIPEILFLNSHDGRSEEHTSELQSPCNLVCRLLLEKKKKPRFDRPFNNHHLLPQDDLFLQRSDQHDKPSHLHQPLVIIHYLITELDVLDSTSLFDTL